MYCLLARFDTCFLMMTSLLRHIVVLVTITKFAYGVEMTNESKLFHNLFKDYNKFSHPMRLKNTNKSVKVEFDFQLINILDVSARNQYIKAYAWVNQYWTNEILTWNPADYGGITEIHVDPRDIWVPDIILYNNIDEEDRYGGGHYTYKANVALKSDGSCLWLNPAIFKSICSIDVTYFPFDDQLCTLKFGSWSFDISKVDLNPKYRGSAINKNYIKNGEWFLRVLDSKRNQKSYPCCKHDFVDVTVTIDISRNSLDYITKLIIPCSLISSMIFLGFVLPPESGERIGLSITVLLAMTVFQQLTSELMPSYGFPLLGQYYFATMIEIGASLAVTTFILNFYHRSTRRMPHFLRKVILNWLSRVAFPFRNKKPRKDFHLRVDDGHTDGDNDSADESDSFARVENIIDCSNDRKLGWTNMREFAENQFELNPRSLSIDNVYSNTQSSPGRRNAPHSSRNTHKIRLHKANRNGANQYDKSNRKHRKASHFMSAVGFGKLNREDLNKNTITAEQERNQNEWMKAARVLDRLFLIISVVTGTVTLFAIFLRAPRFQLTTN